MTKSYVDGLVLPVNQEFLWDKTTIKILSESNAIDFVSTRGRLLDAASLDRSFVEVEALVNSQRLLGSNVLRLDLLAENYHLTAFVKVGPLTGPLPVLTDKFIRIQGVYTENFDASGKIAEITLWSPGLKWVETVGSLDGGPPVFNRRHLFRSFCRG